MMIKTLQYMDFCILLGKQLIERKLQYAINLDYQPKFPIIITGKQMAQNIDSGKVEEIAAEKKKMSPNKQNLRQLSEDVSSFILKQRQPNESHDVVEDIQPQQEPEASPEKQVVEEVIPQPIAIIPFEEQPDEEVRPSSKSPTKLKEESPSKRRKTAHALDRKYYHSSSSDNEEQEMKQAKKRKMTMEHKNEDKQAFQRLPEYSPEKKPVKVDQEPQKKKEEGKFPEEDYTGNILQPSEKMLKKQKELNQMILDLNKCKSRTYFLYEAIPLGTRMTFEVMILQDTIFGREYSFWLAGPEGKVLLMEAKKHLKVLQDYYLFHQYLEDSNALCFMAKMSTDLTRNQFILTNEPQGVEKQDKNIFADLTVYSVNEGKPALGVYFPAFDIYTNQEMSVKMCEDPNILKTMSKGGDHINYLAPCQLDKFFYHKFMQENQLIPSNKTASFLDRQGVLKVHFAKTQSKKYRIYAGSGISPLILFATFIVLFES